MARRRRKTQKRKMKMLREKPNQMKEMVQILTSITGDKLCRKLN